MPITVASLDATIPDGITSLDAFRRWAQTDEFPRRGKFAYFRGALWVDSNMEYAFSHNFVKSEFARVIGNLLHEYDLGEYFTDGMLLTDLDVGYSTIPDGIFVSHERFADGSIRGVGTAAPDFSELIGAPDMVLEIVSRASVHKDKDEYLELYWQAGIPEYWLVDARGEVVKFKIYQAGGEAYAEAPTDADGWIQSAVLGRSFRFLRGVNRGGDPRFTLQVR
jgi:Uma2 family endonuclease